MKFKNGPDNDCNRQDGDDQPQDARGFVLAAMVASDSGVIPGSRSEAEACAAF